MTHIILDGANRMLLNIKYFIIITISVFINLGIYSIENKFLNEIKPYIWECVFFCSNDINPLTKKIIFNFIDDINVEVSNDSVKTQKKYKSEGYEIWIYENNPDMPYFIFKRNVDLEIIISSPASSLVLKEFKKINKSVSTLIDKKTYFKSSVKNLRLRKSDDINGEIIRNLKKGEKLRILYTGKEELINAIKGNWVKVETEKGEIGWCFDAYLEEIKE